MSMKKKLLGLATAVAIALPAGAAYANPVQFPIPVGGGKTHDVLMDVDVVGDNGQLQGQVIVEMPTRVGFIVGQSGTIKPQTLEVKNSAQTETVKVSVDRFEGGNTIKVVQSIADQAATPRNEIALTLSGDKQVNLGKIVGKSSADALIAEPNIEDMLSVPANSNKTLTLSGISGTGNINSPNSISEQFKLVLRLKAQ